MKLSQPIAIERLAELLSVSVIAGKAKQITGINEIHKVVAGDLTFTDHPKYYAKALQSEAAVVLINTTDLSNPLQKTLLLSDDPFRDYNALARNLSPAQFMPQAISPSAQIGSNTLIQHGAVIGNQVQIGDNCIIYPNVVIYDGTIIGNHVTIHANTTIGADAYYYKCRPTGYDKLHSCGRVLIHDHVEIGAGCTIDKGVSGDTIIGYGTKMDNHVHIAHGVVVGEHCLIAAQVGIAGKTTIGNHVTLWGQVGVSKDLHIGDHAVILAQSGVSKSLEGGKTYFGSPAEEARGAWRHLVQLRQIAAWWSEKKP